MQRTTLARAISPNLKTSIALLLLAAACLAMAGCGGDGNCYTEGCTFANSGNTTTGDTTTSAPTAPQNDDPGTDDTNDQPTVVVVVVPSTGGDTSAGGGTTIGSEIAEPLDDAPSTTTDTDNRPALLVDQLAVMPTIDGSATTTEWGGVQARELATWIHRDNSQVDRGGATARLGWFGGDLYISAHIPDAFIGNDDPAQIYQDDSGEIFLDLGAEFAEAYDSNDYQILTRHHNMHQPAGEYWRWQFGNNSSTLGRPSVSFACRYHHGTRSNSCEYRVTGLGLYSGRTIGFDYQINDDDDGGSRDHKTGLCPGVDFADQAWFRPAAMCRLVIR
jgi:hypothetical protein